MTNTLRSAVALIIGILVTVTGIAQEADTSSLAKDLANPIASLISVPINLDYDQHYGPLEEGDKYQINIQPVIPFSLNDDWNLISRTIVPLIDQNNVIPGTTGQSGLGDITEALWFSPSTPTEGGWTWGIGPQFLIPIATNDAFGGAKWAGGPTAIALKQQGPWTYGALIGHLASFAGDDSRADISITNFQPFLAYVTPNAVTYSAAYESTYNRRASDNQEWSAPLLLTVSKVLRAGDQLFSLQAGVKYWSDSPDNGPDDWGFRLRATLLYPR